MLRLRRPGALSYAALRVGARRDERDEACVVLEAGRAAGKMRAQAGDGGVGVGARELQTA